MLPFIPNKILLKWKAGRLEQLVHHRNLSLWWLQSTVTDLEEGRDDGLEPGAHPRGEKDWASSPQLVIFGRN